MRDCPDAVPSAAAARSNESESVRHMQEEEMGICFSGCTVWNAVVRLGTEP